MRLLDRHLARGAVHLARRSVNEARDTRAARGLEGMERALHVRAHVRFRRGVAVWNRDERREVEHDLPVLRRTRHAVGIANVARDDLDFLRDWRLIQPSPASTRIVVNERARLRTD